MTTTLRLQSDPASIKQAAGLLTQGGLVAFPTETVYGLGADARNNDAVGAIYTAKGRPSFNPLIVHIADLDMARGLARFDKKALRIANAFWPGPLTLVLPLRPEAGIAPKASANLDTIALRMPAHTVARALLAAANCPVAAPSANLSGRVSPTQPEHVLAGLDGKIDALVDGGACQVGLESTILDLTTQMPKILRAGSVTRSDLKTVLPEEEFEITGANSEITSAQLAPKAPGQLISHYAPDGPVQLDAEPDFDGVLIGFGPDFPADLNLSETGDLREAAANLFAFMHRANTRAKGGPIGIAAIPGSGIGRAINDRIRRAAAPRNAKQ